MITFGNGNWDEQGGGTGDYGNVFETNYTI